jgi:chromosome segregation ATPase
MSEKLKKIEDQYSLLNVEHIALKGICTVQETRLEGMQEKIEELEEQVWIYKAQIADDRKVAEEGVKKEMDVLMDKNFKLTEKTVQLVDLHCETEDELTRVKILLAECRAELKNARE